MKYLSLFILLSLSLVATSCGDKKNDSGGSSRNNASNPNPLKISQFKGTVDFANQNGQYLQVGNMQFRIIDTNGAMAQAFNVAQQKGVFIQTQSRYYATVSGYFSNGQQVTNQQNYNQQGYNQIPQGVPYVQVTSAVFSRK